VGESAAVLLLVLAVLLAHMAGYGAGRARGRRLGWREGWRACRSSGSEVCEILAARQLAAAKAMGRLEGRATRGAMRSDDPPEAA